MADVRWGPSEATELPLQWPLVGRHEQLELFGTTLADPHAHGFVIHGPPGVGKTRLADQCLAEANRAERYIARATATEGSRSVPLGALAHLLPESLGSERRDLVAVMSEVRPVLRAQGTNGPLVLFVDDLHLLDSTSATFVGQLVDAGLLFLVATVRTGASVPPALESLWLRARVRRVDLGDLDRAGVDTLLHLVLRGPVEASTVSEIWTASVGNVLFLRELVLGAIGSGGLVNQHGLWRLVGPLVPTQRLNEVVAARLGTLSGPATEALETLAVWEPAGLATLLEIVERDELEALDRAGLLAVRTDRRRREVSLAHPLYGEMLRDGMAPLTRQRLLLDHADRIDAHGARRREDAVRGATARLEASGSAEPRLLLRAARLARYASDFAQVERLSTAALADAMLPEAGLLLGEALHELGSFAAADEVLTAAEQGATDPELLLQIAEIRSRNLMWGLLRHDEALEVNRAARDHLAARTDVEELTLNEGMLLTYSGRPREALAVLDPIGPLTDPRRRALRALAEAPALVAVGRVTRAATYAAGAFAEQSELPDQIAIPGPGVHLITQIYALTECGRLDEATALATAVYEAIPSSAPPDALMWISHQLGRSALLSGRVETARGWLGEALARSDGHPTAGARRLVLSLLAVAHGMLGDAPAAAAATVELEQLPAAPFAQAEQALGPAWSLVAAGDLVGARERLQAGAEIAAATGYRGSEAWLLHDVARLGHASAVAGRLREVADACEGDLFAIYADHAAAAASSDAELLISVTDRFEATGAALFAAEAATEAAQAARVAGDGRAATALAHRAATLAQGCEGARTPGLAAPVLVVPLTSREREIAVLAAQGTPSKDIAERLFLSVRTVNNHLQSAYTKLGVAGRRELPAALGGAADVSPEADRGAPPTSSSPP